MILMLYKMQTALLRIWNRVTKSTLYNDSRYTTSASWGEATLFLDNSLYVRDHGVLEINKNAFISI